MLDKQDLMQIKEVVQEVVHEEIVAVKEELHEEIVVVKEELHEEIVAVKEELYADQNIILEEIERTRNILEGKIIRLDNRMAELESCYRSDKLEHEAINMQYGNLEKRVERLERKMA